MSKHIFRTTFTVLGIVTLFPLCYFLYILFLQSDLYLTVHGIGDGMAEITTWQDINANGIREKNEPPLSGVCVGYGYSLDSLIQEQQENSCQTGHYFSTDRNGRWGEFLPGENCTGGIYVYALAPSGYLYTTDMVKEGCSGDFGFTKNSTSVSHKVVTPNEFARHQIILEWIRKIIIGLVILAIAGLGTIWFEKRVYNIQNEMR